MKDGMMLGENKTCRSGRGQPILIAWLTAVGILTGVVVMTRKRYRKWNKNIAVKTGVARIIVKWST